MSDLPRHGRRAARLLPFLRHSAPWKMLSECMSFFPLGARSSPLLSPTPCHRTSPTARANVSRRSGSAAAATGAPTAAGPTSCSCTTMRRGPARATTPPPVASALTARPGALTASSASTPSTSLTTSRLGGGACRPGSKARGTTISRNPRCTAAAGWATLVRVFRPTTWMCRARTSRRDRASWRTCARRRRPPRTCRASSSWRDTARSARRWRREGQSRWLDADPERWAAIHYRRTGPWPERVFGQL